MHRRILKDPLFEDANARLLRRFWDYHRENPWVYETFKHLACEMQGVRHSYSAWTIIQKIRWDYDVTTAGDPFRINNDYIALYARLLIAEGYVPESFFELRQMKKHDRRYSAEERYRRGA